MMIMMIVMLIIMIKNHARLIQLRRETAPSLRGAIIRGPGRTVTACFYRCYSDCYQHQKRAKGIIASHMDGLIIISSPQKCIMICKKKYIGSLYKENKINIFKDDILC